MDGADRPAWVLTTARALQLREALEKANAQTDEDYMAVLAKLWPDLSLDTIMEGVRWAIDFDPVGIDPECDGMCVTGADVGVGTSADIAYPHPGCPLHAPDQVCGCDSPEKCMSPSHGKLSLTDALKIRHRQNPDDPRAG